VVHNFKEKIPLTF